MEFGQRTDGPSYMVVISDGSLSVAMYGAHDGYTYTSNLSVANGGDGVDVDHTTTKNLTINTGAIASPGDRWRWLGFSADMSGTSHMTANIGSPGSYTIDE